MKKALGSSPSFLEFMSKVSSSEIVCPSELPCGCLVALNLQKDSPRLAREIESGVTNALECYFSNFNT